jgi:hypothetical protein
VSDDPEDSLFSKRVSALIYAIGMLSLGEKHLTDPMKESQRDCRARHVAVLDGLLDELVHMKSERRPGT